MERDAETEWRRFERFWAAHCVQEHTVGRKGEAGNEDHGSERGQERSNYWKTGETEITAVGDTLMMVVG